MNSSVSGAESKATVVLMRRRVRLFSSVRCRHFFHICRNVFVPNSALMRSDTVTPTAGETCEESFGGMCLQYVSGCTGCVAAQVWPDRANTSMYVVPWENVCVCVCIFFRSGRLNFCVFNRHRGEIVIETLSTQRWQNKHGTLDRQESQHRRNVPSETEYVGAAECVCVCVL